LSSPSIGEWQQMTMKQTSCVIGELGHPMFTLQKCHSLCPSSSTLRLFSIVSQSSHLFVAYKGFQFLPHDIVPVCPSQFIPRDFYLCSCENLQKTSSCDATRIVGLWNESAHAKRFVHANDVAKSATHTATAINPLHPHLETLLVPSDP
jgi:hypothetical protein